MQNYHRPPPALALLLAPTIALLAVAAGCSARVEVETTAADIDPPVVVEKTAVELDLFTDRESEPAPEPPAATPEKCNVIQESRPAPEPVSRETESVSAEKSVKVVRNVVNIYEGDLHLHNDTHNHFHGPPRRHRESVKVLVEIVQHSQRDARCERLRREHEERVAEWGAMFQRGGR